ncbi:MAG: hypothetical protein BMS9Abin25_0161 [Gammaproteobacteria bacterium]|nr:MAG: hypothetical protein BMS9Abin25_0161 [Gammaproteobacteria bacterium]
MNDEAVSEQNVDNDGRVLGMLSIAAAPGALLISPTYFPLLAFFLGLMGLTLASPRNRYLSIIGIAVSAAAGIAGYYFNTPII